MMPSETQSLYFHLCMSADDDGVVEAFTVMRTTEAKEDSLKLLVAKGFIKILNEEFVTYIVDWLEHNMIRPDRKISSIYKELLISVMPDVQLKHQKPRADTGKPTGRQLDVQRTAQYRLGKDSIYITPVEPETEEDKELIKKAKEITRDLKLKRI